jgi:hypothetical protein
MGIALRAMALGLTAASERNGGGFPDGKTAAITISPRLR